MVVMTMVVVMRRGSKRRGGKNQDQKHCSENLLHGLNVTRWGLWKRFWARYESTEETTGASLPGSPGEA